MATFVVIHQRYSDGLYIYDYVDAATEWEAGKKVWPKYSDEYMWCTTEQVDLLNEDIPF